MLRRDFLRLGALGASGLSLPALMQAGAVRASEADGLDGNPSFGRAKRCLLVFLNGGPSQLDTWDMKPEAPAEVRGELKPIATNVPGIQCSELMPLLSQQVDKFKLVRSVTHPCSVHTTGVYTMLTGTVHATPKVDQTRALPEDRPHLGSIVARWRGDGRDELPPFVTLPTLFEAPPVEGIWAGQNAGFLGRRYDPFVIRGDKATAEFVAPALELPSNVSAGRLGERRELLAQVNDRADEAVRDRARGGDVDTFYDQAFSLLASGQVREAYNLDHESESVRDRYGRHLFGQGLLLARRLVEAGVALTTVYWIDPTPAGFGGGEYDSHGRIYYHMRERLLPPTDKALSALFVDLDERGLLDDTLVIVMSEFGRTPQINKDAGRDHWPHLQSILLAGAGISGGSVFGASDRIASLPTADPVTPADLTQTILHLLGVPRDFEIHDQQGRAFRACGGMAMPGLYA
ncbi:MAG: DUF1501 domain-containing protein [Pirellulales bacterium]